MKLHEYQAKGIFSRYGVPIPEGVLAETPTEARRAAQRLGRRVVVKAQVLVGGRGKSGGIRPADSPQEAESVARQILGTEIRGLRVRRVLVDEAVDIAHETYLGVVVDRSLQHVVVMASSAGGIEIEEVAKETPEKIARVAVDVFLGLRPFQTRQLAAEIGLQRELWPQFEAIAEGLHKAFVACDASLAEINPLVTTGDGRLLGLDAKMVLDDSGLFRHPDLAALRDLDEETTQEREAREHHLSYVKLDGDIGCMVNGAGLAMTTMDVIKLHGGAPANFLDIGGGAQAERVALALRILLSDESVKAALINIFGGITRCDEVARGLLEALGQDGGGLPMVVRLVGTNEEEGRRILSEARVTTAETLSEAADLAVRLANRRAGGGNTRGGAA